MRVLPMTGSTGRVRIESGIIQFHLDVDLGYPSISFALIAWTIGLRFTMSLFGYCYFSIIGIF